MFAFFFNVRLSRGALSLFSGELWLVGIGLSYFVVGNVLVRPGSVPIVFYNRTLIHFQLFIFNFLFSTFYFQLFIFNIFSFTFFYVLGHRHCQHPVKNTERLRSRGRRFFWGDQNRPRYVKSVFVIHVGGTRCITSSTDNIMKILARITLNVEFIRTCIFIF
jgi:hypothetical protein